jgi:hypothetical protein
MLEAMKDNSSHDPKDYSDAVALRKRQLEGKERMRKRLAALSFSEKIKILEKLRDREKAIAASGLRRGSAAGQKKASKRN